MKRKFIGVDGENEKERGYENENEDYLSLLST